MLKRNTIDIHLPTVGGIRWKWNDYPKLILIGYVMEPKKKFIPVHDLDVYRLARKLSSQAWLVYDRLTFQQRKIWGDQMLTAVDSVGANITEGYARFHFSEKSRFYYIPRTSLSEGVDHWIALGLERGMVNLDEFEAFVRLQTDIQVRLNNLIKSTYTAKNHSKDGG